MLIGTVLAVANVVIGLKAGSTSVVAAGAEFAGDVLASGVVFLGMLFALRPPDWDHPYGHGRAETLAGLLVGLILAAGGIGICFRSLQQAGEIHEVPGVYAIWPLVGAVVVKSALSTVKFRCGRQIRSAALVADGWNDAVDVVSGLAALASLGLTLADPRRFLAADHYGGFVVGLAVILTGLRIVRDASLQLMDTMPGEEWMERIRRLALGDPEVAGVEKCYARKTGLQYHVDLHLEVDPNATVWESHQIASRVRRRIREELDWVADVLVHVEPSRRTEGSSAAKSVLPGHDGHRFA